MLQPGTQIGRYEIQRRLGRGGMGAVYVAHDPVLGRLVAIKVFQADLDLPDAGQRFTKEARAAAALNHTNIVTIHDFGNHESQPFIVMEYIQGETLAALIRHKVPTTVAEKLSWLEQLCGGAAYAHKLGVIHRDIKPTNLIIDRTRRLKILDFGIAKMLGTMGTSATAPVGTPGYMAPEQILGEMVDQRSDVFAIGVVAYELLTGNEAFPGESVPAITYRILTQPPKPMIEVCPDLPESVTDAVERAMSKKPVERFESGEAFRAALMAAHRDLDAASVPGLDAPTIIRSTPAPVVRPGSGGQASRAPIGAAVGAATPVPDGLRTDRQRLEELREQQVRSAVADARTALAAGDLIRAQNACLQALMLKGDDPDALALEVEIEGAHARDRATELVEEAREEFGRGGLTGAFELLEQARVLAPELTQLKRLDRDLRLARAEQDRVRKRTESVQQALDASDRALASGDVEGALALARQALDLQPDSPLAREAEAAALKRLDEETGAAASSQDVLAAAADAATVVAGRWDSPSDEEPQAGELAHPTGATTPEKATSQENEENKVRFESRLSPAEIAAAVRLWLGTVPSSRFAGLRARLIAMSARDQKRLAIGFAVALLVLVVAGGVLLVPSGPTPTGTVTLDAIPWATVSAIEGTDGSHHSVPEGASTPISVTLPVGTYKIHLIGPPPASESRTVTVVVTRDGVMTLPLERFQVLTPEEYFAPYLATTSPPPAAQEDAGPVDAPPAGETSPATESTP